MSLKSKILSYLGLSKIDEKIDVLSSRISQVENDVSIASIKSDRYFDELSKRPSDPKNFRT